VVVVSSVWELIEKNKPLAKSIIVRTINERRRYLLQELGRLNERIRAFEKRYGMSLEDFEARMGDSVEDHEVWFEWRSLVEQKKAIEDELNELEEAYRRAAEEL